MRADHWERVETLVARALELSREQRSRLLAETEKEEPEIAREARSLIEACELAEESPPLETGPRRAAQPLLGTSLGPYRIVEELGSGGMATVYLGERQDGEFEGRAAIKVLRAGLDGEAFLRRFETERQILANLRHPRIARLLDGGRTADGRPYFVMDWIEGEPIDRFCESHSLSVEERLRLFLRVCEAVRFAHQNLVVHRDLKPSNIFVTPDGEPVLLDFGIAKLLDASSVAGQEPTATEWRAATPSYSSPEQLRGEVITTASDVYSLGVLLHKLLTGVLPFGGDPTEWLMAKLAGRDAPLASRVVLAVESLLEGTRERLSRELTGDLDSILARALSPEPEGRYASAESLQDDVGRYLNGHPVEARPATFGYRARKALRRNRLAVAVAAGVFLLTLGFALAMWNQVRITRQALERAEIERDQSDDLAEFMVDMFVVSHPAEEMISQPSSRELLDLASNRIELGYEEHPGVRGRILEALGLVNSRLGRLERARQQLEESHRLRLELHGQEHSETLGVRLHLAQMLIDENRMEEVRAEVDEIERLARSLPGLDPKVRGRALAFAGKQALVDYDYSRSVSFLQEALEILVGELGEVHSEVASARNQLGQALQRLHRLDEADVELGRCLRAQCILYGDDHPYVAATYTNLAQVAHMRGDLEGCVRFTRDALAIHRQVLDREHPQVVSTSNALALCLDAQGQWDEAAEIFRENLAINLARFPGPYRETGIAHHNLANVLLHQERRNEAIEHYLEARRIVRAVFKQEAFPYLAQNHHAVAMALREMGKLEAAREEGEQALAILQRVPPGNEEPMQGLPRLEMATILVRLGEVDRAATLARRGLDLLESGVGADSAYVRRGWGVMAEIHLARGELAEAEALLRRAADAGRQHAEEVDPEVAELLVRLEEERRLDSGATHSGERVAQR